MDKVDGKWGRFHRMAGEVSGSFGDLGTFLPHVLGVITLTGFKSAGIFTLFGLFYLFSGFFYGIPIAVQPMKVISAAVLTGKVSPAEMAGATLMIGATLLILGVTGVIRVIAQSIPRPVVSGVQLGLGAGLALLGLRMVLENPIIGCLTLVVMVPLGLNRRLPQALTGIAVGVLAAALMGSPPTLPELSPTLQLPSPALPGWQEIWRGTLTIGLPQLSLTLTNAIIVTATLAGHLYPDNRRATPSILALTQGCANIVSAFLGGLPMCHGAGGLASHHRFGARTGMVGLILGTAFLITGLWFGEAALAVLRLVPEATLGALLFYGALDLAFGGWAPASRSDVLLTTIVAALAFFVDPAAAIVAGLVLFHFPVTSPLFRKKEALEPDVPEEA